MSSVFSRLGYNFDSNIFGEVVNFTEAQKQFYNGQTNLTQWQIDNLANNSTSNTTSYFQNPMFVNLSTLSTLSNTIIYSAGEVSTYAANALDFITSDAANTLILAANTLSTEISSFIIHTNNLSNVTQSTDSANTPDYNMGISIGRQVLSVLNQTDKLQNNIPVLANFTSLTIVANVASEVIVLTADAAAMANVTVDANTMNLITVDVTSCYTLLNTRRTSDVSFYKNSLSLLVDYQTTSQFNNLGVCSDYLIQTFIGTPTLVSNLQS